MHPRELCVEKFQIMQNYYFFFKFHLTFLISVPKTPPRWMWVLWVGVGPPATRLSSPMVHSSHCQQQQQAMGPHGAHGCSRQSPLVAHGFWGLHMVAQSRPGLACWPALSGHTRLAFYQYLRLTALEAVAMCHWSGWALYLYMGFPALHQQAPCGGSDLA